MAAAHALGDTLWFMESNKPTEATVDLIKEDTNTDAEGTTTTYSYRMVEGEGFNITHYGFIDEASLFATKVALLESL